MTAYKVWYETRYYIGIGSNENKIIYTNDINEAIIFTGLGQLTKFLDKIGLRDSINKRYDPIHY